MMADTTDEFDLEIENAAFDIESEEDLESSHSSKVNCEVEEESSVDQGIQSGLQLSTADQNFLENADANVLAQSNIAWTESHGSNSSNFDNNHQLELDDGFDDLLSQIDENQVKHQDKALSSEKSSNATNLNAAKAASNFKIPCNSNRLESSLEERNTTSHENSSFFLSQDNSFDPPPIKRRFPGPAGILPHLQREELKYINMTPHPLYHKVSKLVSGNSDSNNSNYSSLHKGSTSIGIGSTVGSDLKPLSKAPWKCLMKTLNLNNKDENDLLNILNIKWIRSKAKRLPKDLKIPFLAVVVQGEMEVTSSKKNFRYRNPTLKLMDQSGTIVAAFNPNFVEAYGDKLVPGTALALRNCGVLRLKKHIILTVAKKNLLCLATTKEIADEDEGNIATLNKSTNDRTPKFKLENGVYLIQIGPLPSETVLEEYKSIMNKLSIQEDSQNSRVNFSSQVSTRPVLFNTVSFTRPSENPFIPPYPKQTTGKPSVVMTGSADQDNQTNVGIQNFSGDTSSGFDDDDDEDLLNALEFMDFVIDEDSM